MKTKKISCHSSCKNIYLALRTQVDEFEDLITLINKHPKLATTILGLEKKGMPVECTFPFVCNKFPCPTLTCYYDNISNDGTPWRRT